LPEIIKSSNLAGATEDIAILVAIVVADPIQVGVRAGSIAEYGRGDAVVAAVVDGEGKFQRL
jgi:hypothetical protein